MAVVFVDGFDLYNGIGTNTGIGTRWVTLSGSPFGMVTGRFGGQALRLCVSGATVTLVRSPVGSTNVNNTLGIAFRWVQLGVASDVLFLGYNDTPHLAVRISSFGAIEIYRANGYAASVLLATSVPGVVFQNTWHFMEFSAKIDGSTGSVAVKLDGATVIATVSSINTQVGATAGVNMITGRGGLSASAYFDMDDMYLLDSVTPIGECRVETLRANGDTATADWTPNSGATGYTQVDETLANSSDYIQSTNVGDHSLFEMSDLSTTPTAIFAVSPVIFAEKTDSATRSLNLTIKSGATDEDGSAVFLGASYNAYRRIDELNPNTSTAWTKTTVDAVKVGPKVAS